MKEASSHAAPARPGAVRIRGSRRTRDAARAPRPPASAAPSAIPTIGEIGLNGFAPYLLNRLSAQWNARLGDRLKELGLSTTMFRALAVLTVSSGITVNELALFAVTEQSTMSRTLDALEEAELIRRQAKTGDLRVREVFVTEQGLALFTRIWPDIYRLYADVFAGVDEAEFRAFLATLQKLVRNTRTADP